MVISKDWSVRTKNGTVCKDIYLRLWPWPCLHIEDHFYVKQDDQFKKNGFKEILNWDLQDLINRA